MGRTIRRLHHVEPPTTREEIDAACPRVVRTIGGGAPCEAEEAADDRAVTDDAPVVDRLLDELLTSAPPTTREEEAARAEARSAARFGRPA